MWPFAKKRTDSQVAALPEQTDLTKSAEKIVGPDPDRPITTPEQDAFGRVTFAKSLARYIQSVPNDQSTVFALTGPWGTGKTSVLNLIEDALAKSDEPTHVLRFNPWLFSGTHEVTAHFMRELAVQVGNKGSSLSRVAESIATYGSLLSIAGSLAALGLPSDYVTVAKAVAATAKTGSELTKKIADAYAKKSIHQVRTEVEDALRASGRRFLVVIDDLDRLDADEVRVIFKLVRLVADFPNVSYLLSFDRARVEKALSDVSEEWRGGEYLAKIVQTSFALPLLDDESMRRHLTTAVDRALDGRNHGPFHEQDWLDILLKIVLPLIKTPRDAARLANVVAPIAELLGDEVALEDVIALEAVRLFLPNVHAAIQSHMFVLTDDPWLTPREQKDFVSRVQNFTKLGGEQHTATVRELCKLVFPVSRRGLDNTMFGSEFGPRWRKERRVAHREVLDAYLTSGIKTGGVPARLIREIVQSFDDASKVNAHLSPLDGTQIESMLDRLLDFHAELSKKPFEDGLAVVFAHADRMRVGRSGVFDIGSDITAERLALFVVRSATPERREEAIRTLLAKTPSLTWRIRIVDIMKRHDVVSDEILSPLRESLRAEILSTSSETLLLERAPARVVAWATYDEDSKTYSDAARTLLDDARVLRHVLAMEVRERQSAVIGSSYMKTSYELPLVAFTSLFGGEDALRTKFREVLALGPGDDDRQKIALSIAQDFVDGRISTTPQREDGDE